MIPGNMNPHLYENRKGGPPVNGVHTSAKAEGNKDIKLGAHAQIGVGVGVTVNLSEASRAAEHARASALALANYLYNKYIPSGSIF